MRRSRHALKRLSVAVVGIGTSLALVAVDTPAVAAEPPKPKPKAEGWTPWSYWTGNPDGTVTRTLYPGVTFHTGADGRWVPVDPKVVPAEDPAGEDVATVPDAVRPVAFGRSAKRLVELDLDGGDVTLSAPGLALDAPEVDGDEVEYVAPAARAVLTFRSTREGVKHDVLLAGPTSPTSYRFRLSDPNGVLGNAVPTGDGGYRFDKPAADGLYLTIPAPVAYEQGREPVTEYDEEGDPVPSARLRVTKRGAGFDIVESVDAGWLKGKQFPVVLDPSLTWSGATRVTDCAVTSNVSALSTSDCASVATQVGADTTSARRLLLRYDVGGFPSPAQVTTASLLVTPTTAPGATVPLQLRAAGASWDTNASWLYRDGTNSWPTGNPGGAPGAANLGSATLSPGSGQAAFTSTDLKNLVAAWIDGSAANTGLVLKGADETATSPGFVTVATTEYGTATGRPALQITYNSPPDAPTSFTAARGDQSASLSWTAPANNGSAITGYTIDTYAGATLVGATTAAGTATSKVVTGLTNGTSYTFTITATNGIGTGPAATSNAVTPAGVPFAPTGVSAARGDTAAAVSWTAAGGNGDAVTGNVVYVYAGASFVTSKSVGAVTSTTVTGLTNGTSYTFKVAAQNTVGTGPQSAASNAVTPAGLPFAPSGVAGTPGNGSADVTWTAANGNGDPVTGNTVSAYVGGVLATSVTVGAVTSATVPWLSNGTTYTFTVKATNGVGTGAESAASAAVTVGVPGRTTNVTAVRGDQSATVSWTAPAANGAAISGYSVKAYQGATLVSTTAVGAVTSGTVTGLTNGTSYTFVVYATNVYGNGADSAPSAPVTPAGTPLAPQTVTATAGDQQATVTWSAAAGNGSPVTGYTVRAYAGPTLVTTVTVDATTLTRTFTGLANGTAHHFTVAATNAVGTGSVGTSNSVTPAGVPFAPTGVTATSGDQQLTVTWTAPADNGSPVTGYTVKTYTGTTLASTTTAAAGATSKTVTGLTNGTSYYATVAATNAVGTGSAGTSNTVTPAGAPFAPTNVTATRGDSSAVVSWTAPGNNGAAITSYVVKAYAGSTLVSTTNVAAPATSATVTGLTNGTAYTFKVAATNSAGTGADSAASSSVTPAGTPYVPTAVTATRGDQQASVTWTAPSDNGSAITGYTVRGYQGSTVVATVTVGAVTSATVTGLTNGQAYTFKVTATNAVGTSAESAASNAVTPAGLPGAPTGVSATTGNASAVVSWTAPASDNGSAITTYVIKAYTGTTLAQTATVSAPSTTGTVTGLVNGTTYTFRVAATTSVGTGADSAPTGPVTVGVPGVPTGIGAVRGDQSATVSWTAPAANGGSITGYALKAYSGTTLVSTTNVGPGTTGTVTGLTNGMAYTFSVTAQNAYGSGGESVKSPAVTPAGVPFAPAGVSATGGDGQATVTWSAASGNGTAVTGYQVKAYAGTTLVSTTTVGAVTTATVTGLANGTSYTFGVHAVNAVGTGPAGSSASVTPAGTPFAPGGLTATPGDTTVGLTWSAPLSNGAEITSYAITVIDPDGDRHAPVTTEPNAMAATVTGLTNGLAYDIEVAAVNRVGTGAAATANDVTPVKATVPVSGGQYVPVTPTRIVDTRSGLGGSNAKLTAGTATQTQTFTVTGVAGVPESGVSAVALSVVGIVPSANSYLTVWPAGKARPQVSQITMTSGQTTAGQVVAKVGANGQVSVYLNAGSADVLMDVQGYYTNNEATTGGSRYVALSPSRVADTRSGVGDGGATPLASGTERAFTVAGAPSSGIPSTGVTAVVVAVTAVSTSGNFATGGFLSVYRNGDDRNGTSNVNFTTTQSWASSLVQVPVDSTGKIAVLHANTSGSVHIVIDVEGYYTASTGDQDVYIPVSPNRIYNTVNGHPESPQGDLAANTTRSVTVAGARDPGGVVVIPAVGVSAAVLSIQAATPNANGSLTVYPSGEAKPALETVVFTGSSTNTASNSATYMAKVGTDGKINVFTTASTGLVIDVMGYFQSDPPAAPFDPVVTSTDYPQGSWAAVQSADASFTLSSSSLDIDHYLWALDDSALSSPRSVSPASSGSSTATLPLVAQAGWHTLYVQAVDRENQVSGIVAYEFGMAPGGITSPAAGTAVQSHTTLTAKASDNATGVVWKYRRVGDTAAPANIPVGDVTNNGAAVTSWPVATSAPPAGEVGRVVPALVWNAAKTLGVDGAYDVFACFRWDNGASDNCAAPSVTIRLDRGGDASATATTAFGPGTLNLLTGNLTTAATDTSIDSFASDLTVSRSFNTGAPVRHVPGASEHLTANQVDVEESTTAGFGASSKATIAQATSPVLSQAKSLKVSPAATGLSNDSFAHIGGDQGTLRLNLKAGRSYTFTTNIFVPSATGLPGTGARDRSDRAVAFWEVAPGVLTEGRSNAATAVDQWQQLTLRFTVPVGSAQAFIRLYNGRPTGDMPGGSASKPVYYDKMSLTEEGVFGPGWVPSLPVSSAGSSYAGLTDYGPQVHVTEADGSVIVFAKNSTGEFKPTGDDAMSGLTLKPATITNGTAATWTLGDLDGNATVFKPSATYTSAPGKSTPHAYRVDKVTQPGSSMTTTYAYDSNDRVSEMLAPVPSGITCTGGSWGKGCRALQFTYNANGHLTAVVYKTADSSGGAFLVAVSCYAYDEGVGTGNTGRLLQQWDPRLTTSGGPQATCGSPLLPTTYGYDTVGRLTAVAPPGLQPVELTYDASGRVATTKRTHAGTGGTTETSTVVYGVPVTAAAGGPHLRPDMTPARVALWRQTDVPVGGVAVFPPAGGTPGVEDLRSAQVLYVSAAGRIVNTASFGGVTSDTDAAGWRIDTTAYRPNGDVLWTLDAANRAVVMGEAPAPAGLTLPATSADRAAALSTVNQYSADGMDVVDTYGPLHLATVTAGGAPVPVREHTHHEYDTGAELGHPAGERLHLEVLTYTAASQSAAAMPVNEAGKATTVTKYALSASDATGWTFRKPMQVVIDPDGLALSSITRYDRATGSILESRQPGNLTGDGPGTVKHVYYTVDAASPDSDCDNRPDWAGLLCKTFPAAQPVPDGTTPGVAPLPTKWIKQYDYLSRPTVVEEAGPGGPALTTTTSYENSGYSPRLSQVAVAGGIGAAVPATTSAYHPTTGLLASVSSTATAENPATLSETQYDDFGRITHYDDDATDALNPTVTTYDSHGRVASISNDKTTRTFGYDGPGERRGLKTSVTVNGLGTLTGAYDAAGRLAKQAWPNGVTQTWTHDPVGEQTRLVVADGGTQWLQEDITADIHGRWTSRNTSVTASSGSTGGAWTYRYDAAGRLVRVSEDPTGTDPCVVRTYTLDANSNRTAVKTYNGTASACQDTTVSGTVTHRYDTADRLLGIGSDAGLSYDAFGRVTTLPAADTAQPAGGDVTLSYFANDLVREVSRGTTKQRWTLDAAGRHSSRTTLTGSTVTGVTVNHYADSSDSPSWVTEDASGTVTRYVTGLDGVLVASVQGTTPTWHVTDLHGDVVAKAVGADPAAPGTGFATDEFGVPRGTSAGRYGWLGGRQRAGDVLGGLTLMGVRVYAPVLGRFLQVDPVVDGAANAYDYVSHDPLNAYDLDGKRCWTPVCRARKAASAIGRGVANAGRAAWSGVKAAGSFAWRYRSEIAFGLGVVGMFTCPWCAGIAYGINALSTGAACRNRDWRGCAVGASSLVLGGAGGYFKHVGRGMRRAGRSLWRARGVVNRMNGAGLWMRGFGRTMLGYSFNGASRASDGYEICRNRARCP